MNVSYDFPHPKSIILIGFFSASLFSPSTASSFTISSMNSKNLFICLNLSYMALCTAPLLAITPMSASGGMTVPSARMYFFFRFCDSTAFGAAASFLFTNSLCPPSYYMRLQLLHIPWHCCFRQSPLDNHRK